MWEWAKAKGRADGGRAIARTTRSSCRRGGGRGELRRSCPLPFSLAPPRPSHCWPGLPSPLRRHAIRPQKQLLARAKEGKRASVIPSLAVSLNRFQVNPLPISNPTLSLSQSRRLGSSQPHPQAKWSPPARLMTPRSARKRQTDSAMVVCYGVLRTS